MAQPKPTNLPPLFFVGDHHDDTVLDVRLPDLLDHLIIGVVLEVRRTAERLLVGGDESLLVSGGSGQYPLTPEPSTQRTISISLLRTTESSLISAEMDIPVG